MDETKDFISKKTVQTPKQPSKGSENEPVPLYLNVLVAVLSVLAIVQLIVLLVLVDQWRGIRVNALKKKEQIVCVDQTGLKSCPVERKVRNESCCGPTSRIVGALIEQYSVEKFRNSSGARMLSEKCLKEDDKPVAKIPGLDMTKIRQQGEGTVVFWDESNADKIIQNVFYTNGCIRVVRSGYYYVYSQIIMSKEPHKKAGPANSTLSPNGPFFSHSLYRRNMSNPRNEKLLESFNSPCDTVSEGSDISSYIGAVFKFETGDIIHVETSHPQSLADMTENNFFGLYSV